MSRAWRDVAPYLLFLVVAVSAVSWHMAHFNEISPIDEVMHYDYIENLPHVPVGGEKLDQNTMREAACRTYGPDSPVILPPCHDTPYDPNTFPETGFSTAGSTPPVYYLVTAVAARPLAAVTPWSAWDISRALGALWLAGLLSVCYLLALRVGAPRIAAMGAALMVSTSTDVVSSSATIGPDVATAVSGGLVVLAALSYDGTRHRTLLVLGSVLLASLVKFTSFTAIGAAIILLLVAGWARRRDEAGPRPGRSALLALGMFAVFSLSSLLWGLRYKATNVIDISTIPMNQMFMADRIRWEEINSSLYFTFVTPITGNWNALFLESFANVRLESLVVGVLAIGVLAAALTWKRDWTVSGLSWGVLVLALLGPLMLTLLNFYANGLFFGPAARYGFALLPAYAALAAWTLRAPGASRGLLAIGALSTLSLFL